MAPRFFLITSRGQMATTWLTNALNTIPGVLAVHGTSSEAGLIDAEAPLGDRLRKLSQVKAADHYGFVHCVNDAMILQSMKRGDLRGLNRTVVQLFRNPIMLMEAMACEIARKWRSVEKYPLEGQRMRQQVLAGRWRQVSVTWPESVRTAVVDADDAVVSRLTGVWWRCALEAEEAGGYVTILDRLAQMGADAPFAPPVHFQFEDFTAKRDVFAALVNTVSGGGSIHHDAIETAFASPQINQQRNTPESDAERVWHGWSGAEQDMFKTICATTGLLNFLEAMGLYRFSFIR